MRQFLKYIWLLGMAGLCPAPGMAGIEYDAARNIIWVSDYPVWRPCVMDDILRQDTINKWKRTAYNYNEDLYEVVAHVYIGDANGRDTYFQIGDHTHPQATIKMHGNLVVSPDLPYNHTDKSRMAQNDTSGVNALTLGRHDNPEIRPRIQFAPGCGLQVGPEEGNRQWSGEIYVHNAEISGFTGETGRVIGIQGWLNLRGRVVHLLSSRIADVQNGIRGVMGGGWNHRVYDMVFENMGVGMRGYWDNRYLKKPLDACCFINCETALENVYGQVLMKDCVFRNNRQNWSFNRSSLENIFLENCEIDGCKTNGKVLNLK